MVINSRKHFALVFLLVLALSTNAQYKQPVMLNDPEYDIGKRLRFGFSVGINTMNFTTRNGRGIEVSKDLQDTTQYFADVSHLIPGFNVNAIVDYRLSDNFHLRFLPGYAFGQRDLNFFYPGATLARKMKIESSFIEMPLGIKYSADRVSNARPYLLFGGNYRVDLAAYKKLNVDQGVLLRLIKGDMYYEIGYGIDFYLEYFKFSVEFKYSVGLFNVLSPDNATGSENFVQAIDRMNSQLFVVAFHFE
jgi:hypothetical protein